MTNKKSQSPRRLGRGLDALLGAPVAIDPAPPAEKEPAEKEPAPQGKVPPAPPPAKPVSVPKTAPVETPQPEILRLKLDEIRPAGRAQPRTKFDPEGLAALQESIRAHGVLQPVLVRPLAPEPDAKSKTSHRWQLIAGERRWRAAQAAGLRVIPALVRTLDDAQALEVALVENIQRAALTPVEEATAFATLIEDFRLSQAEVAARVGKSRAHVANLLRLLTLPYGVREFIDGGRLGIAHALLLLQLDDRALMESIARTAVARNLTVRQLQKLLTRTLQHRGATPPRKLKTKTAPDPWGEDQDSLAGLSLQAEHLLAEQLGAGVAVSLAPAGKEGGLKASLHLHNAEEVRRFYHVLLRFWHHLPAEEASTVAKTWRTALRHNADRPQSPDLQGQVRDFLRLYVDILSSQHLQGRPVRSAGQATGQTPQKTEEQGE